jgi:hypothetical protein
MDWYSMTAFQVRVAVVGGGTGEALAAAGITPGFTATKVSCLGQSRWGDCRRGPVAL